MRKRLGSVDRGDLNGSTRGCNGIGASIAPRSQELFRLAHLGLPYCETIRPSSTSIPNTMLDIHSPLQAHIAQCVVKPGDAVTAGQLLMVLEAMKMEHEITAPMDGEIRALHFSEGETVGENDVLMTMQPNASSVQPVLKQEPASSASTPRADL
ncbi:MAG: hypothetical protein JZU63_01685, partial [Rhodoferax sp.]|nr:hypothetical protein [Rhodoferax sp.]